MSLLFAYSSLPPLDFSGSSTLSIKTFYELVEATLTEKGKEALSSLKRIIDIKNIFSLQTGVLFDPKGNLLEQQLRLSIAELEHLPPYILDFLEENKEPKALLENIPKLYTLFYKEEISKGGVIKKFLTFERDIQLLLFGCAGKQLGIDLEKFLNYEDLTDPIVSHLFLQKKSSSPFIFPYEYKALEEKLLKSGANPMKQYLSVATYRFDFYKGLFEENMCTFEGICAYMMCLWILEEKKMLDEKQGRKVLIELVEGENE